MEVYRIALAKYADKLLASGMANRWNLKGQNVIYAGAARSLSTLELLVHRSNILLKAQYKVMVISVPDDPGCFNRISVNDLPSDWQKLSGYAELQQIGSRWYQSLETLVLQIPSVIIPQESNYVINTEHPDFDRAIKLISVEDFFFDSRLVL